MGNYLMNKEQQEMFKKNLPHVRACFPKGTDLLPCQTCGYPCQPSNLAGKRLCDNCWGVEVRLNRYLNSTEGRGHILQKVQTHAMEKLGMYIGPEEQFKGRLALCVVDHGVVGANFNEGEYWETHSRLNFPPEHWKFEESDGTT